MFVRSYVKWQYIASQIGDGTTRSSIMIKNLLMNLISKLAKLGIVIREPKEMDCIPEVASYGGYLSPQ